MESKNKSNDFSKGLYLGLLITEYTQNIISFISSNLKELLEVYPNVEDAKTLQSNLENSLFEDESIYANPWKFPKQDKHCHVTTLFKKGKSFLQSHPVFTSFEDGKEIIIKIKGLVYVPEKIITSLIFTDTPVENEFPHMTTLVGYFAPKNSNDVCQALFSKGKVLEKEYKKLQNSDERTETSFFREEITVNGKKEIAYVILFQNHIEFGSKMKCFYK